MCTSVQTTTADEQNIHSGALRYCQIKQYTQAKHRHIYLGFTGNDNIVIFLSGCDALKCLYYISAFSQVIATSS